MQGANRGGPGRGQGRKPVKQGEETVTVSLRMTPGQRTKLAILGGAEWVRQCIEAAPISACAKCGWPHGDDWLDGGETCPRCKLVQ